MHKTRVQWTHLRSYFVFKALTHATAIIGLSVVLSGTAVADETLTQSATLQYVGETYQLTMEGKHGKVYSVNSLYFVDLEGILCENAPCEISSEVHGFFAKPRPVSVSFETLDAPEAGATEKPTPYTLSKSPAYDGAVVAAAVVVNSIFGRKPHGPEPQPEGATLVSPPDRNELFRTIAQAYPGAIDAPTATVAGSPTFWHYVQGDCVRTRLATTSDAEESAEATQEAACRQQKESDEKAAAIAAEKKDADEKAAAAAAEKVEEARKYAEQVAAAREAKKERERERIAAIAQHKKDALAAKIAAQQRIAQTIQSRRDMAIYTDRCTTKLDLASCVNGRFTAWSLYSEDSSSNRAAACEDGRALVILWIYQAQLTARYLPYGDIVQIDVILGDLIDNCPDQASWALGIRKRMHGL